MVDIRLTKGKCELAARPSVPTPKALAGGVGGGLILNF